MERLVSGEISTLEDLASETGFTVRYISRTLRAAFLAPDITETILDGLPASDLTVRNLMDGFPADWQSQRLTMKNSDLVPTFTDNVIPELTVTCTACGYRILPNEVVLIAPQTLRCPKCQQAFTPPHGQVA
jgi:hypothetical protein